MGTRALTVFVDGRSGEEIAVLYRQHDGYPSGHGAELAEYLAGKRVVNGISGDPSRIFNGASGLAAQVVAQFADANEAGGFYLYPAGTRDAGEEYIYTLTASEGSLVLRVFDVYGERVLFEGSPDAYAIPEDGDE